MFKQLFLVCKWGKYKDLGNLVKALLTKHERDCHTNNPHRMLVISKEKCTQFIRFEFTSQLGSVRFCSHPVKTISFCKVWNFNIDLDGFRLSHQKIKTGLPTSGPTRRNLLKRVTQASSTPSKVFSNLNAVSCLNPWFLCFFQLNSHSTYFN